MNSLKIAKNNQLQPVQVVVVQMQTWPNRLKIHSDVLKTYKMLFNSNEYIWNMTCGVNEEVQFSCSILW